jgi:hypothetical protein
MDYLKLNMFNMFTIWLMVILLFLFIGVLRSAWLAYAGGLRGDIAASIVGATSTG